MYSLLSSGTVLLRNIESQVLRVNINWSSLNLKDSPKGREGALRRLIFVILSYLTRDMLFS